MLRQGEGQSYKQRFFKNMFFRKIFLSNGHAKVSFYNPNMALIPPCWAPNLGSFVHYISVPGSVADTHNSNKIDIKNHTFIANGENISHGSGYIA